MNLRYEICRECGLDWNVSKNAVIPAKGYLCPRCSQKSGNAKHKKMSNK